MSPPGNPSEQKQPVSSTAPALAGAQPKPKRHNAKFCSFSNRQRIVNALAAGDPKYLIARALHVSEHTVYAVAEQEWQKVAERKARIAAQFERIATKSCDLLAQKLDTQGDSLTANQLVPIAGVSVDKLLALRGEPNVIARIDVEHGFNAGNIFEAFQQFHDDAQKIINARKAQHPHTFPALPDSPPTSPGQ